MKALSLLQPWATLIATGEKRYETRSWKPRELEEETVAIHASAFMPADARELLRTPHFQDALGRHGYHGERSRVVVGNALPRGAILAIAEFVGFWRTADMVFNPTAQRLLERDDPEAAFGDWRPTSNGRPRWCWAVAAVRPLYHPVPCKGKLGLWEVPTETLREVLAQVRDDVPAVSRADALERCVRDSLTSEQLSMFPAQRARRRRRQRPRRRAA